MPHLSTGDAQASGPLADPDSADWIEDPAADPEAVVTEPPALPAEADEVDALEQRVEVPMEDDRRAPAGGVGDEQT